MHLDVALRASRPPSRLPTIAGPCRRSPFDIVPSMIFVVRLARRRTPGPGTGRRTSCTSPAPRGRTGSLRVVGLVLRGDASIVDALLRVRLDELDEVLRERRQRRVVALHHAAVEAVRRRTRCRMSTAARLHPGRRRPRAGPEADVGLHRLRRLDVRDQLLMSRSIEKLASAVSSGRLVERVAIHRVVAGADRDAAAGEARAVGAEQQLDRLVRSAWLASTGSSSPSR